MVLRDREVGAKMPMMGGFDWGVVRCLLMLLGAAREGRVTHLPNVAVQVFLLELADERDGGCFDEFIDAVVLERALVCDLALVELLV